MYTKQMNKVKISENTRYCNLNWEMYKPGRNSRFLARLLFKNSNKFLKNGHDSIRLMKRVACYNLYSENIISLVYCNLFQDI